MLVWVQVPSPADAEVAELADAHGSGPCGSNTLWVRLPSSAYRLGAGNLDFIGFPASFIIVTNGCFRVSFWNSQKPVKKRISEHHTA